jgi:hypothetical protein
MRAIEWWVALAARDGGSRIRPPLGRRYSLGIVVFGAYSRYRRFTASRFGEEAGLGVPSIWANGSAVCLTSSLGSTR